MSAVFLILLLSGVVFGIIGCFGVKRYGAKTTIIPGIIGATLSASILAILLSIAVPTFLQYRETSRENTINALQKLTDQANEKLPVMIDPDTRFDRIDVIAPDLLKYKFTFVNNELSEFDAEQFLLEARPQLIEHYRTSDQFKMHRENGISVQFSYYSKNGEFLTNIPISADSISNKTATSDR